MTNKQKPLYRAYEIAGPLRRALSDLGRCMEVTEDKHGILWERWLVSGGRSVLLMATPHFVDVFTPVTDDMTNDGTIKALQDYCNQGATND
jgi:hypothetical protein